MRQLRGECLGAATLCVGDNDAERELMFSDGAGAKREERTVT